MTHADDSYLGYKYVLQAWILKNEKAKIIKAQTKKWAAAQREIS